MRSMACATDLRSFRSRSRVYCSRLFSSSNRCPICRVGEDGDLIAQFTCRLLSVRKDLGAHHLKLRAEERQVRGGHVIALRHGQELLRRQTSERPRRIVRLDVTQDCGVHEDLRDVPPVPLQGTPHGTDAKLFFLTPRTRSLWALRDIKSWVHPAVPRSD